MGQRLNELWCALTSHPYINVGTPQRISSGWVMLGLCARCSRLTIEAMEPPDEELTRVVVHYTLAHHIKATAINELVAFWEELGGAVTTAPDFQSTSTQFDHAANARVFYERAIELGFEAELLEK